MDLRHVVHPQQMSLQKPLNPSSSGRDEHDGGAADKSDRISETGDPIYYTIESDKDSTKPKPLMRNCVSLENLGGITINNELTTAEEHHKNALTMQQHPHSRIYNPAGLMSPKYQPLPQFPPQWHPSMIHPHDYWRWSQFANQQQQQHVGGMMVNGRPMNFVYPNGQNYGAQRSNANSKQSLASDDYRKYRDVAL